MTPLIRSSSNPSRSVPMTFDANAKHVQCFSVPHASEWTFVRDVLQTTHSRGIAAALPLWYQLTASIEDTADSLCPLYLVTPQNIPSLLLAIRDVHIDTIVTIPSVAKELRPLLKKFKLSVRNIIVVSDVTEPVPKDATHVSLQMFPGGEIFHSCAHVNDLTCFHKAPFATIAESGSNLLCTSLFSHSIESKPLPFCEDGVCACGKPSFVRI